MRKGGKPRLGLILVAAGVLFVLSNAGVLGDLPGFFRVVLWFVLGAGIWLGLPGRRRLPPRLAVLALIYVIAMASAGSYAGTAALGFPAMAFALVYLANPRNWWAIIPAGVLASLTLLVTAETLFPRWDAAPLLFLGFAGTFTFIYLLPKERGGQRWALYPALGWIALTVLVNDPVGGSNWFLPLLLIGAGVALLWFWQRRKPPGPPDP